MRNARQKLPKNAAKVEFIRVREDVKSMLNAGYNLRNIHAKLVELHNIAMSYYTLCLHVRKLNKKGQCGGQAAQQPSSPPKPAMPPKLPPTSTGTKVTRPEDIDHGELF
jgi:hypothetical protein